MNFQQRFARYMVGIFIGVLVSFMLFGQRSCTNWLPGKRIRDFLTEQPISLHRIFTVFHALLRFRNRCGTAYHCRG